MASSTTIGFPISISASAAPPTVFTRKRRRRTDPQAGRALEILGHSIEYLTDEFVNACCSGAAVKAHLEAVQLLMALNRKIYFGCPEVPTIRERIHSFLHLHAA